MAHVPSVGWRGVYEWCRVPMTPYREPQVRERERAAQHKTMSQTDSGTRSFEEQIQNRLETVRFEVADAQGADDLDELEEHVIEAAVELVDVRAEIRSAKREAE